jgi:hypothetical protein
VAWPTLPLADLLLSKLQVVTINRKDVLDALVLLAEHPLAEDNGWDFDGLAEHIFYDTCVYHQPGIDLLVDVVPTANILFGSEMVGAVRGIDPNTGNYYDDTKIYLDHSSLDEPSKAAVFDTNIRRVYPRLAGQLGAAA